MKCNHVWLPISATTSTEVFGITDSFLEGKGFLVIKCFECDLVAFANLE